MRNKRSQVPAFIEFILVGRQANKTENTTKSRGREQSKFFGLDKKE